MGCSSILGLIYFFSSGRRFCCCNVVIKLKPYISVIINWVCDSSVNGQCNPEFVCMILAGSSSILVTAHECSNHLFVGLDSKLVTRGLFK